MEQSSKSKSGAATGLRLPRRASIVGVVLSTAYTLIAVASAPVLVKPLHIHLAAYGGILLFPHAVAIAYVASGAARGNRWLNLTAYLAPIASITPILAILNKQLADILVAVTFAPMIPAALVAAKARRASVRLSMNLVAATYALTVLTAIAIAMIKPLPSTSALAYAIVFDVTLIYAVTHHAFPATFKDKPHVKLSPIPHILALVSGAAVLSGRLSLATLLLWASTATYIFTAKLYKIIEYSKTISGLPEGPAKAGMKYFIYGHAAVILSIILLIVSSSSIPIAQITGHHAVLVLLHTTTIAFTMTHIAIHEPMMIPVILGLRHKRRFYPVAPFLLAISGALWPIFTPLSYILLLAGLALMAYMTL